MKKIIVASKNPVKIASVLVAFRKVFPNEDFEAEGVSVSSGVSDQPMSEKVTLRGAFNRVVNASINVVGDFWVGIEGGIEDSKNGMEVFAWIVVKSKDKIGKGRTGSFFLPEKVSELVRSGLELGDADDKVFNKSNSKQKNGSVGLLTKDLITRTSLYEPAVILALIPFLNSDYYFSQ